MWLTTVGDECCIECVGTSSVFVCDTLLILLFYLLLDVSFTFLERFHMLASKCEKKSRSLGKLVAQMRMDTTLCAGAMKKELTTGREESKTINVDE